VTLGAAAATVSYLTILWVYTRTQIAVGATLRDTSIVFAALIGVVVLGERITWMRVAAVALVAAGAGALRFA
jgi:drug/metabolite transporter (DMT)-like permease